MHNPPSTERPTMRRALPGDEVTVRCLLPAKSVTETEAGLTIRTCRGGVIGVPRSVLAESAEARKVKESGSSKGVLIEIRARRDLAGLLSNLTAEIVRLTRELDEPKTGAG
jgi:hypothetical protein